MATSKNHTHTPKSSLNVCPSSRASHVDEHVQSMFKLSSERRSRSLLVLVSLNSRSQEGGDGRSPMRKLATFHESARRKEGRKLEWLNEATDVGVYYYTTNIVVVFKANAFMSHTIMLPLYTKPSAVYVTMFVVLRAT
ncbi:hypothetical protein CBL_06734 [Carabus blaptoides fortunei]